MNALGVDISKGWFDVCLLHGEQRTAQRFDNNLAGFAALHQWLAQQCKGLPPASLHMIGLSVSPAGRQWATCSTS